MKVRGFVWVCIACGLLLSLACAPTHTQQTGQPQPAAPTQETPATEEQGSDVSFSPQKLAVSDAQVRRLTLPAGFQVGVFARGVADARVIAVGADGTVYVSQPELGQITALWDRRGTGQAETRRVVVSGIPGVHGLAVRANKLYLAAPTRVYVADINADGSVGKPRAFINNLPAGGRHPHRTMAFGPDGLLYVSVGSDCNDCAEKNPELATILQMHADGSGRRVFARGLRNTMAFAWHPASREMWGVDQGSDNRGPNTPPEELNHIIDGGDYGWPWCYGDRQVDALTPGHPDNTNKAQFCPTTQPMVLGYQAHSSPIQLVFYTGTQFPAAYRKDAFITFHGSWNRRPAVGYKVVRIRFDAAGRPTGFEDFLTGFLTDNGSAQFGRPAGLALTRDGALLIGDDSNGVIYRVTYKG